MLETSVAVEPDAVFVGIDWGNSHHQLCVIDAGGVITEKAKISHDAAGAAELERRLHRHRRTVGIAIERSEGLLVEALQRQGHRLFCVSPKMSARARERYRLAPTKNDAFDAFVLADSLRHEHCYWRPLATPSPLLAELRALTRDRKRWMEFLDFLRQLRRCFPTGRLYVVLDNFSPHKKTQVRQWCDAHDVELVFTPTNASWTNWIECEFTALRYFALNGSDYPDPDTQNRAIAGHVRWRNQRAKPKTKFAIGSKTREPNYLPLSA